MRGLPIEAYNSMLERTETAGPEVPGSSPAVRSLSSHKRIVRENRLDSEHAGACTFSFPALGVQGIDEI